MSLLEVKFMLPIEGERKSRIKGKDYLIRSEAPGKYIILWLANSPFLGKQIIDIDWVPNKKGMSILRKLLF